MFTSSEKKCLALTLAFLVLGAGLKLWRRHAVIVGPVPSGQAQAITRDHPAPAPAPADTHSQPIPEPDSLFSAPGEKSACAAAEVPGPEKDRSLRRKPVPRGKVPPAKVALNRAGIKDLSAVPGIGPKTAGAILVYRKTRGEFKDIRDLLNVKGIGEKKLEKMRAFLVISPLVDDGPERQALGPLGSALSETSSK